MNNDKGGKININEYIKYKKAMSKKTLKERQEQATPGLFNPKPDTRIIGKGEPNENVGGEFVKPDLLVYWMKPNKESSQIAGYAYDEKTQTLALKFVKGASVYTYSHVPKQLYHAMLVIDSEGVRSLGSFLSQNVTRNTNFKFTKER